MMHNTRSKHGKKPRYQVHKKDIILKHGTKEKPHKPRLCWLCTAPMNWHGKNIEQHHIYGRANSGVVRLVHHRCHMRIHQDVAKVSNADKGKYRK